MKVGTYEFYKLEFEEKRRSPDDIAVELGTYGNKIRRELKAMGFKLRNKSEAQSAAIESGRHPHPTRGSERPKDVKLKISEGVSSSWHKISEEERDRRSDLSRKQWDDMSEDEKAVFRDLASTALRKTSREGSKIEKFLARTLPVYGYYVEFHRDGLIPGKKLQLDIYVPSLKTAIEIDGPSHYYPIWGQESLDRTEKSDADKNSSLISYGFVVVRVRYMVKNLSQTHERNLLNKILETLNNIKEEFPKLENRIIQISIP